MTGEGGSTGHQNLDWGTRTPVVALRCCRVCGISSIRLLALRTICSEMCLCLHVSLRDVDKLVSTELDAAEISEIQCLFPAAMARTQCNVEISPKHATFSDRSFTSSTKRTRFCFF